MKEPIFILFLLFIFTSSLYAQSKCELIGPSIACVGERVTVQFDSDELYNNIRIDAYTVINGTQELALTENETDNSADIIFLSGGDSEIVVRFLDGNNLRSICNLNVFVFDEDPIPALGVLSNFVEDQVTCASIDLEFDMFIACPECPFYWTLNDEEIQLEQQSTINGSLQLISAQLELDEVGSYTFCQNILKPDSTCFVEDCISIDIIELETEPSFSLDETESIFCKGTTLQFTNETIIEEEVIYIWEINYDSLQWRYFGEDLAFDFLFAGEYTVSLFYILSNDNNCVSPESTMNIEISDASIIPITCNNNSCKDSIFSYQTPIKCTDYQWVIDQSLGTIISDDTSGVTIKWNAVDNYTETKIKLLLNACSEDACNETFRNISLFPANLIIDGAKGVCDRGSEWYQTDLIPNAIYSWEIEMIDSISGIPPKIIKLEENRVRIAYNSFVGNLNIKVNASVPAKGCEINGVIQTTSLLVNTNDNLCPGDLFKASLLPKIDQNVRWTLSNNEIDYFNQQIISGQNDFFAFDFVTPGIYNLDVAVPELEFECGNDFQLTILDNPQVSLLGPRFICPGDSVTYTLQGLGANDNVAWTIFQSNGATELEGNEITILWEEGGAPYSIKVSRSTEVMVDQFCESGDFLFDIYDYNGQSIEVTGPEVVCYDAQATYEIIDFPGSYIWKINPTYMGTIIDGDSTELITIQWHYAPNTPFATLSTEREVCDSLYKAEIDVYFEPFIPELMAPDSICPGETNRVELLDLVSYQTLEYYLNDSLVKEDAFFHDYRFLDTGWVEVKVEVVNPNGCPGVSVVSKLVYVKPKLNINLATSMAIAQCPKESFQNVVVEVDYQDSEAYYIWQLDGIIQQEGFGEESLFSFVITKEMIDTFASSLTLNVTAPGLCSGFSSIPLQYTCDVEICTCIEDITGNVDYLTPIVCNLASFGGSLDFSTIIDPYWRISLIDTVIIIPINGPEDLIQDSFYFDEDRTLAQVALRGTCEGVILLNGEVTDSTFCEILIDQQTEPLYSPDFVREYICNEDLTYDIIFKERSLRNSNPPYNSTVSWNINGVTYDGVSILVENIAGGTDLNIEVTQCSLDSSYCCTKQYETSVRDEFSPNIILPNGSCENDLWLFALDVKSNDIVSALWDFGDGSGSTLITTTKGFLDTLSHDISVVVVDNLGCMTTAETTVKSSPNIIDGTITFDSNPCAASTSLVYVENSETSIENYVWNVFNSPDTSSIAVSNSGNYTVTVTDVNGCTDIASIADIKINESFVGGMRYMAENCGVAAASILANDNYSYVWYVDGEEVSTAGNIQLFNPGEYEIKVISTSLSTNEVCDSIVKTLVIYPLPEKPVIASEKIFCDPFITELSILNYPTAKWSIDNILTIDGSSILVSQNGTFSATVEDENGCINRTTRVINEVEIPFDQLLDQCIQACREDLDSLALTIPGMGIVASDWTWVTVDSLGVEYEVAPSSGIVTPLTITSDMYDYIQLQIVRDDCSLRSERIPLDIELCNQPDPPVEIICETISSDHASCGQSIYKCLVSAENGGPKLYFEGSVTLPMGAVLCTGDSLNVSLNNGHITITDIVFEESDGKIMAFYSANISIADAEDYEQNGVIFKFEFCNEEGELGFCYEYTLPFRSCSKDFNCLIDYMGISSGINQTVDVNFCLNLSDVVQDNCTLNEYNIRAYISDNENRKILYTEVVNGTFDNLHCISIPVSYEDFYESTYQCIELLIDGDCPGISCAAYQCGILGNSYLTGISNNSNAQEKSNKEALKNSVGKINKSNQSFLIYPNPSTGLMNFVLGENQDQKFNFSDSKLVVQNSIGQIIKTISINQKGTFKEDFNHQNSGLYLVSWICKGELITSRRFILLK